MQNWTITILSAATVAFFGCGGTLSATGEADGATHDTPAEVQSDIATDTGDDVPADTLVMDAGEDPTDDTALDGATDGIEDAPADTATEPDVPAGCTAPLVDCGGACVDVSSDEANCGSCGHGCDPGQTCGSGSCGAPVACPPGYVNCGWLWAECRDVSGDPENCGDCEAACGDMEVCQDGACVCRPGLVVCPDGCRDIAADADNCGGCGSRCAEVCVDGSCLAAASCLFDVCDGACVDTGTDPRHCGGCGDDCERDQLCVTGDCRDYEPAVGCVACAGCEACPWGEICCEVLALGVMCIDTNAGCP